MSIGKIKGYVGGMFAAKTASMLNAIERLTLARKTVVCFKPEIDNRWGTNIIKSRASALTLQASTLPVEGDTATIKKVLNEVKNVDAVAFDEVQFFGSWIVELSSILRQMGKVVLFNGLDMTFAGKPFPITAMMMAISDDVQKCHAVCHCCGRDATFSQKLINGKPVTSGSSVEIEDVSGASTITFEARCIECFVPDAN